MPSSKKADSYPLVGAGEVERLELQERIPGYDCKEQLASVPFGDPAPVAPRILDLGCGAGHVAAALAERFPDAREIVGIDRSEERLAAAKQRLEGATPPFRTRNADATVTVADEGTFDIVVARFLLEYVAAPDACVASMRRALRPGGRAVLIDLDGVLFGIHPKPPRLAQALEGLREHLAVDCFIGRKLASLLADASFRAVDEVVTRVSFEGPTLELERANYALRLTLAEAAIGEALAAARWGSGNTAHRGADFRELYLSALAAPGARVDMGVFVAWGTT